MAVGGKTKNNLGRSFKKGNSKKSNVLSNISNKSISPKKTDKFLVLPLHQQNSTSSRQSADLSDDLDSVGGRPDSSSSKFQEDKSRDF